MSTKRKSAPPFPIWRALPNELAPALYAVSLYARAVAVELFRSAPNDDAYTGVIETHGEWEQWLCRLLRVDGKQRNNVTRHLRELKEAGVLRVETGRVTVCIGQPLVGTPSEALCENSGRPLVALCSTSGRTLVELCQESTNCNHTEPVLEREEKRERRVEPAAPARSDLVGFNFVASLLGRSTFDVSPLSSYSRSYAWIGSRPASERTAVKLAIEADAWCVTNKHKVDAPHIERRWHSYLGGDAKPVLKPVVAPKPEPRGIWAKAGAQ